MMDSLGQLVIREKLQRDCILSHLNPSSLKHVQAIVSLFTCSKTLLSEEDLVEVVWKRQNGFREEDFLLRNAENLTVEDMQLRVADAQPAIFEDEPMWGTRTPVWLLETKEEILTEFKELTYLPVQVYETVRGGVEVLRLFRQDDRERRRLLRDLVRAEAMFEMACAAGLDLAIIRRFLEEVEAQHPDSGLIQDTDAVFLAARGGHLEVLQCLVELSTVDVLHRVDEEGMSTLLAAAQQGQMEVITYLIAQGVDTSATDHSNAGLFINACMSSDVGFVRRLLEEDFDWDLTAVDVDGRNAVDYAAELSGIPMLNFLIDELNIPFSRGSDSEGGGPSEWASSLLESAALGGSIPIVDFLVDRHNLDPLALDWKGGNLIFHAAMSGCDRLIDHLISKYGLDPCLVDEDGCTALFYAAEGHLHTITNLVEHGVDVHRKNVLGQSVLHFAAGAGDQRLYQRLIDTYGLDPDDVDGVGNSARALLAIVDDGSSWETDVRDGDVWSEHGESGSSSWETDSGQ